MPGSDDVDASHVSQLQCAPGLRPQAPQEAKDATQLATSSDLGHVTFLIVPMLQMLPSDFTHSPKRVRFPVLRALTKRQRCDTDYSAVQTWKGVGVSFVRDGANDLYP